MDLIRLEGMSFRGRHGVRPAEREQTQEFMVDLEVECDLALPARSDDVLDTVDYRELRAVAKEVIEGPSRHLLEALAGEIADRALGIRGVRAISVRVAKRPAAMLPIQAAAVHIKRTRA